MHYFLIYENHRIHVNLENYAIAALQSGCVTLKYQHSHNLSMSDQIQTFHRALILETFVHFRALILDIEL